MKKIFLLIIALPFIANCQKNKIENININLSNNTEKIQLKFNNTILVFNSIKYLNGVRSIEKDSINISPKDFIKFRRKILNVDNIFFSEERETCLDGASATLHISDKHSQSIIRQTYLCLKDDHFLYKEVGKLLKKYKG